MAIAAVDMESLVAELAAAPYSALVDVHGIVSGPASWYQTLSGLGHFEDKLFHSKNSTLLGNGKKDVNHQDVSGYYVVCDAGEVMLFDNCIDARAWASSKYYVNEVFAPSLSFVMIDEEKLAVVNKEDLVKLILRYPKMKPLPPHVTAHAATSAAVGGTSSIAAMYEMKMRDVDLGRFSVESDAVIRFRTCDCTVAVVDVLVGMGKHETLEAAQEAIWTMIEHDDVKIRDLESLEAELDDRIRYPDSLEVVPEMVRCHHCQLVPSSNASMSWCTVANRTICVASDIAIN